MTSLEVKFESGNSSSKSNERHWTDDREKILVQCLVELHHLGSPNVYCGFRKRYLPILEKIIKPYIDNRLRTLRKKWSIVYDMIYGMHSSDFRQDATRRVVMAEQAVWDEFLKIVLMGTMSKTRTNIIDKMEEEDDMVEEKTM
ncbi:L10-interacting MYB domain-containing protein-like [Gossypium australe]|uniref:L10-interacting MYB domain-containing protein-like n=1 Tax=Gossypium australe TaxID=47621 RepID=A0A5B6V425_9ROSI|nr:L10-interacting MYB domain-containing protein-like [Gossypium australe]